MTRVLSYNIWVGGVGRVPILVKMMRSQRPDLIALIEATNSQVVLELAEKLDMHYHFISGQPAHEEDWHVGLLSRFPFVGKPIVHTSPPFAKPLLEVCVEEADGTQLTIFVAHLIADFGNRTAGDNIRKQEVRALLRLMQTKQGTPHLLMGDFSAIARHELLRASALLRYVIALQKEYKEDEKAFIEKPTLDYAMPLPKFILKFSPIFSLIARSKLLCYLFDLGVTRFRAPHGDLHLLYKAGYTDCFREKNKKPRLAGLTASTTALAARLDFIFASPEMAQRLTTCSVIEQAEDIKGVDASDHLPIFAEFV